MGIFSLFVSPIQLRKSQVEIRKEGIGLRKKGSRLPSRPAGDFARALSRNRGMVLHFDVVQSVVSSLRAIPHDDESEKNHPCGKIGAYAKSGHSKTKMAQNVMTAFGRRSAGKVETVRGHIDRITWRRAKRRTPRRKKSRRMNRHTTAALFLQTRNEQKPRSLCCPLAAR